MASSALQVGAGSDDGYEIENTGTVNTTSSTVYIAASTDSASRYWTACRFCGTLPPKGATISVAYATIYVEIATYDDINVDIYAEDAVEPIALTRATGNITDRTRTTASAAWVADGLGTGWIQSPSLVDVIQELVDDYNTGAILLIFKPRSDEDEKYTRIRQQDFIGNTHGVKLHLEWTAVGGERVHRVHRSNLRRRAG